MLSKAAALLVLLTCLLGGLTAEAAGAVLERPTFVCTDGTATLAFSWRPDPAAALQWLDLSLVDDGFQPGSFLSAGPMPAPISSFRWEGIQANARHFYRINSLTQEGWSTSETDTFIAPCIRPEVPLGGPGAALSLTPGVYVVDLGSGDLVRLRDDRADFYQPYGSISWSPSGEGLAVNARNEVSIYNVRERTKSRDLPFNAYSLDWVAEGALGVTYERGSNSYGPALIDLASAAVRFFLDHHSGGAVFSPDGRHLALTRPFYPHQQPPDQGGIFVLDMTTGQEWKVATGEFMQPAWSPDGRLLAASLTWPETEQALVIFDPLDGVEIRRLQVGMGAIWSPEMRSIASISWRGGQPAAAILVQQVDGSGSVELGPGQPVGWSPDSRQLALLRDGQLWIADVALGIASPLLRPQLPVITEARWSPGGRFIAFRTSGGSAIYTVDVDGRNERYLSQGFSAKWSPLGDRLAFTFGQGGTGFGGAIYTMARDGTGIRRLAGVMYSDAIAPCTSGPGFQWSPDGASIAYWTQPIGLSDSIFIVTDSDGAVPRGIGKGFGPVWSPDGSRIAYVAHLDSQQRGGFLSNCAVKSVSIENGREVLIGRGMTNLSWSADGKLLAGQAVDESSFDVTRQPRVVTVPADGGGTARTLDPGMTPVWSPDGTRIAYRRNPGSSRMAISEPYATQQLVVSNADGSEARVLADVRVGPWAWSPDGTQISYSVYPEPRSSGTSIFVVPVDGSSPPRFLTDGSSPSWSPDGRQIAFSR